MSRSLAVLALCHLLAASDAPSRNLDTGSGDVRGPARRYCGELASGGLVVPVETVFDLDGAGRLSGRYSFEDGGAVTKGTLSQGQGAGGRTRILRWKDRYGEGTLALAFDARFTGFEGRWGAGDAEPAARWTGGPCTGPTS